MKKIILGFLLVYGQAVMAMEYKCSITINGKNSEMIETVGFNVKVDNKNAPKGTAVALPQVGLNGTVSINTDEFKADRNMIQVNLHGTRTIVLSLFSEKKAKEILNSIILGDEGVDLYCKFWRN